MSLPAYESESAAQAVFADRLLAARGGCSEALEACRSYLLAVASRGLPKVLQGKTEPADVVQDAMVQACSHFGDFAGESEPELRGWLRQVLLSMIENKVRRYVNTARRDVHRELSLDAPPWDAVVKQRLCDQEIAPSTQAELAERDEILKEALQHLAPQYREVIQWRLWESLSFKQIARRLESTANAARKLWKRAVEHLREALNAQVGSDSSGP